MGVIDVGTNSVRLLVAKKLPYQPGQRRVKITRLGEGIGATHLLTLSSKAVERTLLTVKSFCEEAFRKGADKVEIVGTQALREAQNTEGFWEEVESLTGIKGRTLSQKEEALMSYRGVRAGLPDVTEKVLVVDIGGGSTEFVAGQADQLVFNQSFPIGSVRVSEKFLMEEDPPSGESLKEAFAFTEQVMADLPVLKDFSLVGVAGTITTVAAIVQGLRVYDPIKIHGFFVEKSQIREVFSKLSKLTLEQRKNVDGLEPARADVILGGLVILLLVMEKERQESLVVSESDLLDGVAIVI